MSLNDRSDGSMFKCRGAGNRVRIKKPTKPITPPALPPVAYDYELIPIAGDYISTASTGVEVQVKRLSSTIGRYTTESNIVLTASNGTVQFFSTDVLFGIGVETILVPIPFTSLLAGSTIKIEIN